MKSRLAALALILNGLILFSLAEDMPVPTDLQGAIFKKVFSFDRSIPEGAAKIVVAYTDSSAEQKDHIVKAFKDCGVAASAIKADQVSGSIAGANVLYILPGVFGARQICQKNRILCITGIPSLVESGEASIGLAIVDNKPKILVHLRELKAEGQELSANLLQLAKIIQ
jgi:hypothetical protein